MTTCKAMSLNRSKQMSTSTDCCFFATKGNSLHNNNSESLVGLEKLNLHFISIPEARTRIFLESVTTVGKGAPKLDEAGGT